ncbi:putative ribonuclease H protein [Trifolium medium]|uniref:Putative ribonuclease H protein n=1 Tax=Trifolium medium TaxID=97028 RepID=A0A392LXN3_9FABA|nr:putative ribonuclease H protein [Trifolium medium]
MACRSIWSWQNKEEHEENFIRPHNQASVVKRNLRIYSAVVSTTTTQRATSQNVALINWCPPSVGWVRLDTNGSCRDGGFIGCTWWYNKGAYARGMNFQAIELHIDSLIVVKAITSHGHGSPRGKNLVMKIKRL